MVLYIVKKNIFTLCIIFPILLNYANSWGQTTSIDTNAQQYTLQADNFADELQADSAIMYYQKAAQVYQNLTQQKKYYQTQLKIAQQYLFLKNYTQARRLLWRHLSGVEHLFLPEIEGLYYHTLGEIAYAEKRYKPALKLAKRAQKYYSQLTPQKIGTRRLIAECKSRQAYFEEALQVIDECFIQLNKLPKSQQATEIKIKVLLAQSRTYTFHYAFDKSLEVCYEAEQLLKTFPSSLRLLNYLLNIYNIRLIVYKNQRKYQQAKNQYHKSISLSKQIYGIGSEQIAFNHKLMGTVFIAEKEFTKKTHLLDSALHYLDLSIRLYKKQKQLNKYELGITYASIGRTYSLKAQYKLAAKFFEQSFDLLKDIYGETNPSLVPLYSDWFSVHFSLKQHDQELEVLQKALVANSHNHRNLDIYTNPKINDYYNIIYQLGSLVNKAQAFANREKDIYDLKQSLRHFLITDRLIKYHNRSAFRKNDRLLVARNINMLNSGNHGKNPVFVCNKLFNQTKQKAYLDTAFYFIERGNASLLMSTLAESNAKKFSNISPKLLAQESSLRKNVAKYRSLAIAKKDQGARDSLIKFNKLYEKLIQQLEQKYPKYAQLKFDIKQTDIDQIQFYLTNGEALLAYSFARKGNNHVLLITKKQTQLLHLPFAGHINDCTTPYYNELQSEARLQPFANASHRLYQALFQPLEKYLKGVEKIIVIAPSLESTPFEALVTNLPKKILGNDFAQLDYLANRFQISYHYSATLWYQSQLESPIKNQNLNLVAFAPFSGGKGITYSTTRGSGLNLPESKVEVSSIFNFCRENGLSAEVNLSNTATKERFVQIAKNARIIHIASHSEANRKNADLAKIRFAGCGTSQDLSGCLLASEIYNLELNADLLVLSSCESGVGKLVKGEGVFSLARSFLYAGAHNIVFSLWEIDDAYTRELMIAFYGQFLGKRKVSYSKALQLAQQKLRMRGIHPKHWAGIVMIGK
ncbi:MAG TPA: hypothetical protein DCS93_34465 [Microscillaceae bacterium]|nr:hypothetical protein [Microscillaceae bacterium]